MGSQVCLLLSILYGNVLSKVAVSIDRALLSRDAQEYYMEEGSREEFRRLLPEHLRTMGPIVDVQELHAVEMLKAEELARRDAEAAERALPITEEWLRSIGAIIDAEDGVVEFCWLPGELVILSGGLLLWTVDCVEVGKIATRGQLLDVHGVVARS